jgi:hypothetical protein
MNLIPLEEQLRAAQARLDDMLTRMRGKWTTNLNEEFKVASDQTLAAERELSLAKGEPTAMACEWPFPWDTGAPMPQVLANGQRLILIYLVNEPDPKWDGSNVRIVDTRSSHVEPLAIVHFEHAYEHKFGGPNDEVIQGHPLYGKGLCAYGAHVVANSPWIREVRSINSVHRQYRAESYDSLKHYLLLFHDDMFECLAESYSIRTVRMSFADAIAEAALMLQQQK